MTRVRLAPVTWAVVGVLALTTIVHLAAQLTAADDVANVTQWFLMPLLALALWSATRGRRDAAGSSGTRSSQVRGRPLRLVLVALAFSWLGDTAPDLAPPDTGFLVMIGFFLVAQVFYVLAFWPIFRSRRPRPAPLAGYVVVLVALLVACLPGTGALTVPAVVYGVCLVAMAALATGVNAPVAVGGAVFLVSDSLIALNAFADWYSLPAHGFWVMATYVVGQALISAGMIQVHRTAAPSDRGGADAHPERRPVRSDTLG